MKNKKLYETIVRAAADDSNVNKKLHNSKKWAFLAVAHFFIIKNDIANAMSKL